MTETEASSVRTPKKIWSGIVDTVIESAWLPALRFALDLDRAAERCKRRSCRKAGGCRIAFRKGKPLECGDGVVPFETIWLASACALFAGIAVRRYGEDVALPLHCAEMDRLRREFDFLED